ncbi:Armadillo-like helical [Penicillium capsulatum]|uniref:Armadillo-like helical n=1 Tax=Penicillium capsulatum TaxID=69766 RepID=A0A9W9IQG1_9EURO|nr:Armadillo-like helical [Penicillium capsulatum]KAJ6122274.1 Armadillo-like helical [Penicillium capsulatum]
METQSSQSPQGAQSDIIDNISQRIQLLSESTLRAIAKGPLVKFALAGTDIEKARRVWQSLLQTLSTPSLSPGHTAAACNAVSAFIDAASNSQNEDIKQLALSTETWMSIFDVFLSRYEDVKPKPLRQNLGSLTTILAKKYRGTERSAVQTTVLDATLPSIILGEPRSRLKGSLACLEVFIRKRAILPSELVRIVRAWLLEHREKWAPLFEQNWDALSNDLSSSQSALHSELSEDLAAKIFFFALLTGTNNRALAGTSSGMMASLLQNMKMESPAQQPSRIWVAPVKRMLLQNPDSVEWISTQVLEPLFTVDSAGFIAFVESLPLKSLMTGDMADAAESEYMLLFLSLQIGKKINLVHDDYDSSKTDSSKKGHIEKIILKSEVIGRFLLHREPKIRIAALSLLVTAFSTTKPFTIAATNALLRGLPSMHAESDSHARGEIMGLTRRLITRITSGILTEQNPSEEGQHIQSQLPGSVNSETETRAFLHAYMQSLKHDLCVTASYPRHISALKAIRIVLYSGLDSRADVELPKYESDTRWKFHMDIFTPSLLRLLIDLLLDPFDEVRHTSASIINLFPRKVLLNGLHTGDEQAKSGMRLTDALARAENTASNTSRADHADTVALLYHILFSAALPHGSVEANGKWWATKESVVDTILIRLEERLASQKGIFNSSLRGAPLHGYMSGLRYIVLMHNFYSEVSNEPNFATWRSFHNRIISVCEKVWEEVKPVLCIDSPEGHSDEPTDDLAVGPKDVLSYSWRALRESSLLFHATMANPTYGPVGEHGLQRDDFERIGRISFTQLAELRHRGAFSTVSQTFATCCYRCSSSEDAFIQELPRAWYQQAKATIFESASKLTRRSAGLPAMVTGILYSIAGTPFFGQALEELHEISRLSVEYDKDKQYLELPQVHAMNCLKDIFTNTKLSHFTEPFIMPALNLSAERLASPIWALRNSGLMLFRALLNRLCRLMVPGTGAGFGGISGSEPGSKISFPKYPGLLDLLSTLLAPSQGAMSQDGSDIMTERIFPALELVGQKIPTIDDNDNDDMMLRDLVREHLKSPVWGIREHAARVHASLFTRANILLDVRNLVDSLSDHVTENYTHGVSLCVQYSLRRVAATTDVFWTSNIDELLAALRYALGVVFPLARSPFVASVLVETINDVLERSIEANIEEQVFPALDGIFRQHDLNDVLLYVFDASQRGWDLTSKTRGSSLLRRALAWCTILRMLSSRKWQEIPGFFRGVSEFDPDAASWIVEQLEKKFGLKERYKKTLVDLYASIIIGKHAESVKTAAVDNLASVLERMLISDADMVAALELPCDELANGFRPEININAWNRHATDSELRLQGCLLALRCSSCGDQQFSAFKTDIQNWIVKLRSALSEETEFTTRYAAVASLQSFTRGLRPSGGLPRVDTLFLDIYLILYDMLNDDDDELRDMAAWTASWVLSYSSVSPNTAVALGPLNASSMLAQFVVEQYSGSVQLARRVIRYLAGQETRISGSDAQAHLPAVSNLAAKYCQDSTVLFVEEKQNLFFDDVREVGIWSRALQNLDRSAYTDTLVRMISSWVSEGLTYLTQFMSQDAGQDGLLGWTSKPESFTLGVRILNLSVALASSRFAVPEYLSVGQGHLWMQLESLSAAGKAGLVHDEWLARIEPGPDFGA